MTRHTVKARLDERLLKEIPRFFGGWEPALKEFLQNCYRGGATLVLVTQDMDGTRLTIEDDGRGCDDPQLLLSAGQTGWDETEVTAPAGMGFFSALDPELFARVLVESNGWRLDLDPKTALLEELAVAHPKSGLARGFRLTLYLTEAREKVKESLVAVRGLYPFELYFNDEPVPPPEIRAESTATLETPVGCFHVNANSKIGDHHRPSVVYVVWEHRLIPCERSRKLLSEHKLIGANQLAGGVGGTVIWEVDPACGVRPKLPDRNAMDDTPQLKAATRVIARALHDKIVELGGPRAARWPDVLHEGVPALGEKRDGDWRQMLDNCRHELAHHLGYRASKCRDYEKIWVRSDSDSTSVEGQERLRRYAKGGPAADADVTRTLMNIAAHGEDAFAREVKAMPFHEAQGDEKPLEVTFVNKRWPGGEPAEDDDDPDVGLVALADRILWGDVELPFLLTADPKYYGASVVFAGTLAEAAEFFRDSKLGYVAMNFIFYKGHTGELATDHCYVDEWVDDADRDNAGVEYREVRGAVMKQLLDDYGTPADLAAQEARQKAQRFRDALGRVKGKVPGTRGGDRVDVEHSYFPATPEMFKEAHAIEQAFARLVRLVDDHLEGLPEPPLPPVRAEPDSPGGRHI